MTFALLLAVQGFGVCKPVEQRDADVGCWIVADEPVGKLETPEVWWHLDVYPSRSDALKARTPRSAVIEALGKVWLMTIANEGFRAAGGERVARIGPLKVQPGKAYSQLLMETITPPGYTSKVHTHSGPEAWLTVAGETCLETPEGKLLGTPGHAIFVPAGPPMHLTATGKAMRRGLTLVLHPTAEPPTTMVSDWKPKGLCSVSAAESTPKR